VVLGLVGQPMQEDSPEPGEQLGLAWSRGLGEVAVGLEEGFLHQVGRIQPRLQRPSDDGTGHQPQVVAVRLQ
jgi:hypothetical protein